MHRKYLAILIVLSLTAVIASCRTAPLYNVESNSIPPKDSGQMQSLDEVGVAIRRAGVTLGWNMEPVEPGHIVGTLHLRTHMAQVDVFYTTTDYRIIYKDSTNLDYDGSIIHKNYNGWIQNLDRGIQAQLTTV